MLNLLTKEKLEFPKKLFRGEENINNEGNCEWDSSMNIEYLPLELYDI
jgi:hypothetical protein